MAEKIAKPELRELVTDVYDDVPEHIEKQYQELVEHIKQYPDAYPVTSGRLK